MLNTSKDGAYVNSYNTAMFLSGNQNYTQDDVQKNAQCQAQKVRNTHYSPYII